MFNRNFLSISAIFLAALFTQSAFAQTASTGGTAAEIQRINENMTLLSSRLAELELKSKIAAKEREIRQAEPLANSSPLGSSVGNPSVVSVAGLKGSLEAVLVFPGGVLQRVKVGDAIGDRRVSLVSINEVQLTDMKGKAPIRLAFGSSAITRENTLTSSSPGSLPVGLPGPPAMSPLPTR